MEGADYTLGNMTICSYNRRRFVITPNDSESTTTQSGPTLWINRRRAMTTSTEFSHHEPYQVLPSGDVIRIDGEWTADAERDREAVSKTSELLTALHDSGVTYQVIADRLGVNWRTIHRWRNRQTHPSTAGLVNLALSSMLGVVPVAVHEAKIDPDAPF